MKIFLFLFWTLTGFAQDPAFDPYQILEIPPSATTAEVEAAYQRAQSTNPQAAAFIEVAHNILSNENTRKQYDSGDRKNLKVNVPSEEVEKLAQMMDPVDPKAASLLRQTKQLGVTTLNGGISFYLAMGVSEAWKCFSTKDPTYCRSYVNSLKEPTGHISLGLFMGASHLTSQGLLKTMGTKISPRAASYFGLAAGALVSEVFLEFYNHPQFEAYLKAAQIKDPIEREKKKAEALKKLYEETYGNSEWYEEKIPTVTELLAASALSERSIALFDKAVQKVNNRAKKIKSFPKGCEASMSSLANLSSGNYGKSLKGYKKFLYNRGKEVSGLLLFFAWAAVINEPMDIVWDATTLEPKLRETNAEMFKRENHTPEKLTALLDRNQKLWDKYRKKQLSKSEEIMALHNKELEMMDEEIQKPYLFHTWLNAGGGEENQTWEAIRDSYYPIGTKPTDKKVQKDKEKYLRGFFCGADPEQAYHDTKDISGLPVPGKINIEVEAYRVLNNPSLCNSKTSIELLEEKIRDPNLRGKITEAYANIQFATNKTRSAKIGFYEKRVDQLIIKQLEGEPSKSSLPIGVIPSLEKELENLKTLSKGLEKTDMQSIVQKKITETYEKISSAQSLLEYMKTEPKDRLPPPQDMDTILGLIDPENQEEWQKVVRYYNSFILQ